MSTTIERPDSTLTDGPFGRDRRWLALALVCLVQFMVVLDVAIVTLALPSIKTALHFSQTGLQWVLSATR